MSNNPLPRRYGKYVLLDHIGRGGMAELFRAKLIGAQGFEKLIALKRILPHLAEDESLVTAFIDEARLAAHLQHPNIVQIYDFGQMEGSYYIAMEYLSGKDLNQVTKQAIARGNPLTLNQSLYIISQVCEGLGYAYDLKDFKGNPLNIIHRDISPQNIFITYDGQVKLLDFGIAKAANQSSHTQTGTIKGKVAYMSPEQVVGSTIDQRSDLFAVGIILYELATHERLYTGEMMEIMAKVAQAQRIPIQKRLPNTPDTFHRLVDRLMARDREERYSNPYTVIQDIQAVYRALQAAPSHREMAALMRILFKDDRQVEADQLKTLSHFDINSDAACLTTVYAEANPEQTGDTSTWEGSAASSSPPPAAHPQSANRKKFATLLTASILASLVIIGLGTWRWQGEQATESSAVNQTDTSYREAIASATRAVRQQQLPIAQKTLTPHRDQLNSLTTAELEPYLEALHDQTKRLAQNDQPETATLYVQEWLRYDGENSEALFLQGNLAVQLRDIPTAIQAFQRITQLHPTDPKAHFNLGFLFAMQKKHRQAAQMYEKTIQLKPDFLDKALYNLARMRIKLGELEQAKTNLQQALQINPDDAKARELLLTLHEKR